MGGRLPEICILMSLPGDSYLKFKANNLMAGSFLVLFVKLPTKGTYSFNTR